MTSPLESLVFFTLRGRQFALSIAVVERIERAVEIVPLADAKSSGSGVINLHGQIVPVFDLREYFGLPAHELRMSDQLICVKVHGHLAAIVADDVTGVADAASLTSGAEILPGLGTLHGVVKLNGDIVLLHDLEAILSPEVFGVAACGE